MYFLKKYYKSTTIVLLGLTLAYISHLKESTSSTLNGFVCEATTIIETKAIELLGPSTPFKVTALDKVLPEKVEKKDPQSLS